MADACQPRRLLRCFRVVARTGFTQKRGLTRPWGRRNHAFKNVHNMRQGRISPYQAAKVGFPNVNWLTCFGNEVDSADVSNRSSYLPKVKRTARRNATARDNHAVADLGDNNAGQTVSKSGSDTARSDFPDDGFTRFPVLLLSLWLTSPRFSPRSNGGIQSSSSNMASGQWTI